MRTPPSDAVIVAAGRGTRAGGGVAKQYRPLLGRPVLSWTLEAFLSHPLIAEVVLVVNPADRAELARVPEAARCRQVPGGESRDASVRAGLAALSGERELVLIHDAARPLVTAPLITRVVEALATAPGAAPGVALVDALWRLAGGRVEAAVPREGLVRAQTPQGFRLSAIRAAHAAAPRGAADDVEVALANGLDVAWVEGDEDNLKITRPGDFARAARILEARRGMDLRTGTGFDVHAFAPGDHVVLGGVRIAHDRALAGHSDADVLMHAITDAIYGALAEGDIGRHFPPSDPRWKGAPSRIFLEHAAGRARARGFAITHVDATVICERPKIGPHAERIRASLAAIMEIAPERVSVKATTSEGLGFTGRGEGIAALVTATLLGAGPDAGAEEAGG